MRSALVDSLVTGLASTVAWVVLARARGLDPVSTSEGMFMVAVGLVVASGVWTARHPAPGGLLALVRRPEPAPERSTRTGWLDRWIGPDNAWLGAGAVMAAASFLPLF